MKYCCDKFKSECESFNEFNSRQDGIGKSDYDNHYYFWFEGCYASFPLIYCPNCGTKLT